MFWSVHATKGGVGTSVVSASLALELALREPWSARHGVVLVDFGGDQPDMLGVDASDRHGVVDWLTSSEPVELAALESLLVPVLPGLSLLPAGRGALPTEVGSVDPGRIAEMVQGLGELGTVVADLGVVRSQATSPRALIGTASDRRTLVLRPCYLALRRATQVPITLDTVVEICEDGRALRTLDVEAVVGTAVTARLRVNPAIARSVDSGTLVSKRPRALRRFVADLLHEYSSENVPVGFERSGHREMFGSRHEVVESW